MTKPTTAQVNTVEIMLILTSLFSPEDADSWMNEPHVLLNGERPTDLMHSGQEIRVLTVLRQIIDGAYL